MKPRRRSRSRKPASKLEKKVRRLAKRVSPSIVNYRWKSFSPVGLTNSLTTSTPLVHLINGIATGLDEVTRVGDLCRMGALYMNVSFSSNILLSQDTRCRIMLVKEETALASDISLAQLFTTATPDPLDQRNVTTRDYKRFHVYYDKMFTLGPTTVSTAVTSVRSSATPSEKLFRINRHFKFVTDYSRGTAGLITDIEKNSLFLICLTTNTIASCITVAASYNLSFVC